MAQRNMPTISIVQPQPRLHTLSLSSPAFDVEILSLFNLGWSNLTRLVMVTPENPSDDKARLFFGLLQLCSNLEHFAFSPAGDLESDHAISLTHSKLRVLVLGEAYNVHTSFLGTLRLPNLRNLHVCNFRRFIAHNTIFDAESVLDQPPSSEGSCHRMFSFTHLYAPDHLAALFNPEWTDITHLRLQIFTASTVFQIIRLCPNLEDVAIRWTSIPDHKNHRISNYGNESPPPPMSLTHYTLRSLSLSEIRGPLGTFLDLLTFPNLRSLNINLYRQERRRWPHAAFKEFFHRSRFPLETLILKDIWQYVVVEKDFTALIPTLRHVEVHDLVEREGEVCIVIREDEDEDMDSYSNSDSDWDGLDSEF